MNKLSNMSNTIHIVITNQFFYQNILDQHIWTLTK